MDVAGSLDQYAAVGLLIVGLSIPLIVGLIPPNRLYGFRTAKTRSDPWIWYAVNRVAGWDGLAAGVTVVLASLAIAIWGTNWSDDTRKFVNVVVVLGAIGFALIHPFLAPPPLKDARSHTVGRGLTE
jgi:hypothetical protein